mmetsp:Transcript_58316/g.155869  ORF Transcript_58316/g.155869 Transcript_58316/m.155869 type:complete len:298 (-) Transcript_58316:55-948(-)
MSLELAFDEENRIAGVTGTVVLGVRSFPAALQLDDADRDRLVKDCAAVFTARSKKKGKYSSGSTFWVAAGSQPASGVEQLALSIFDEHTKNAQFKAEVSGAEWWTQVISSDDEIGFHWDRDYTLEIDHGFCAHPYLGTVTYLSDCGAATVVCNRDGVLQSTDQVSGQFSTAYVSPPKVGKHMSFDGKWLHGASTDIMSVPGPPGSKRVTLLVNIWLNHQPLGVENLPDAFRSKLSTEKYPSATLVEEALPELAVDATVSERTIEFEGRKLLMRVPPNLPESGSKLVYAEDAKGSVVA